MFKQQTVDLQSVKLNYAEGPAHGCRTRTRLDVVAQSRGLGSGLLGRQHRESSSGQT